MEEIMSILDFVEEHLIINSEDNFDYLTIPNISKSLNISSSALQNSFKQECFITIGEYITRRRMSLASNDLIKTPTTIIDIAQKYGYTTDGFTRKFKAIYKCTPSEYRKNGIITQEFNKFLVAPFYGLCLVERNCLSCESNIGVCCGIEYGESIDKMIKKYPNGCDWFDYSLDAYIENEERKELLKKELLDE